MVTTAMAGLSFPSGAHERPDHLGSAPSVPGAPNARTLHAVVGHDGPRKLSRSWERACEVRARTAGPHTHQTGPPISTGRRLAGAVHRVERPSCRQGWCMADGGAGPLGPPPSVLR